MLDKAGVAAIPPPATKLGPPITGGKSIQQQILDELTAIRKLLEEIRDNSK